MRFTNSSEANQCKPALPRKGVRRLEIELGAWFEGACGFALVLSLSQMMEHGLGPFGRADLHPRRNPLDRQGRFAPQPGSACQLARAPAPASGQLGLLPAPPQRLERFLVDGLQPPPFHLPLELLTPRCGVLPNACLLYTSPSPRDG